MTRLLGPGDVMEFDVDGEPDEFQRDDVESQRHPFCEACGNQCCFCPLACEGWRAKEVDEGVFVHEGNCERKYDEDLARGEDDATPNEGNT